MKVKVKEIEIQIGKQTIKLTVEEAQELKEVLNNTFPEKEYIPLPWSLPPAQPYQPPPVITYDFNVPFRYTGSAIDIK